MNEFQQVWLLFARMFVLVLFVFFYSLGGRTKKVLFRRILGTLVLTGGTIGISFITFSFSWWFLLSLPAYFGALSLGYGGDSFWEKLLKRSIYGIVLGACSFTFGLFTGLWMLCIYQVVLSLLSSVILGVFNIPKSAVKEEALIALTGTACVPFLV